MNGVQELITTMEKLRSLETRDAAILRLINVERYKRENFACIVWENRLVRNVLMHEIISAHHLMIDGLTTAEANRLTNILTLLQCFAKHKRTRLHLAQSDIPYQTFPFLMTKQTEFQYELLRQSALLVFVTLAESKDTNVLATFLSSDFFSIAMVYMEYGSDMCRLNATYAIRKMLDDLNIVIFVCDTKHYFNRLTDILHRMLIILNKRPITRLLRQVVKIYLAITDYKKGRHALKTILPEQLRNQTFAKCFEEDPDIERFLQKLTYVLWFQSEEEAEKNRRRVPLI